MPQVAAMARKKNRRRSAMPSRVRAGEFPGWFGSDPVKPIKESSPPKTRRARSAKGGRPGHSVWATGCGCEPYTREEIGSQPRLGSPAPAGDELWPWARERKNASRRNAPLASLALTPPVTGSSLDDPSRGRSSAAPTTIPALPTVLPHLSIASKTTSLTPEQVGY